MTKKKDRKGKGERKQTCIRVDSLCNIIIRRVTFGDDEGGNVEREKMMRMSAAHEANLTSSIGG